MPRVPNLPSFGHSSSGEIALRLDSDASDEDLQKVLRREIQQWKVNWRSSLPFFQTMAKAKLGRLAVRMVDLLRDQRVQLTAHHLSIAMGACGGGWQLALHLLFSALKVSPESVDDVVYNSAINACKVAGQWEAAVGLIYAMSSHSMACNARSCSTAISACEKACEWENALSLLGSLKSLSVQAEIFSYTAAIKACAGAAHWTRALSLFQTLSDGGIVPAEVTYNTAIAACGNGSQWQRAVQILDTAIQNGICTAVTYNAASFACGEAGAWKISLLLLEQMQQQRALDGATFNTAITNCGRNSQWQKALALFAQVSASGKMDKITLAAAISACDMGGQWQAASLLLEEAIDRGLLTPQCFTSAISACERQWEEALHLFTYMSQLMVRQGFKGYGAVISACCQADRWDMGLALLMNMLEQSVTPGGCHVGSLAESLTRTLGPEVTYDLLLHFRQRWQSQTRMDEDTTTRSASQLADISEPRILKIGCSIVAIAKPSGTRTETIFQEFQEAVRRRGYPRCSLVSRLDLPTSGVLPVVLDHPDSAAAAWYQSCFAGRLVSKDYLCLCEGETLGPRGTKDDISVPLITRQLPDGGILAMASREGRAAKTEYEVLRRFHSENQKDELILLQAHPLTGRTHQIRVHLAEIGRPLVGDATYGSTSLKCPRLFLHCQRISLPDFAGHHFSAVADLPLDLEDLLSVLDEIDAE